MAFCPNCGQENQGGDQFCGGCGIGLDVAASGSPGPYGTTTQDFDVSVNGSFYGLTRKSVWLMIFLTIITLGIYGPYWYLTRHQRFNALSSAAKFTQTTILIWLGWFVVDAVFIAASFTIPQSEAVQLLEGIEAILNLVAGIYGIVLAFRAKRIILEHLSAMGRDDISMSGVATFFFGFFYIQYKINRAIRA